MKLIYDPNLWHYCDGHNVDSCNNGVNCYSYILNRPDYFWAVPGLGFTKMSTKEYFSTFNSFFSGYNVEQFRQFLVGGAETDGLIKIEEPIIRDGYYLAMLAFPDNQEDFDFHWYRQDDNGEWSHKNGWHKVNRLDDGSNKIHDPRKAVSKDYPIFGGFFLVPESGIKLDNNFPTRC